ncbi:MAG: M16 family metallopeptidase [Bacteroidales bacterium]
MHYQQHTLSNGLRIIHLPTDSAVSYCGYAINGGTRDEYSDEFGMAHFVEHLLFKGTLKRRPHHIINRMESVGGELNAYTSKEETLVYAIFPGNELERAVDLLSDLVFNSTFPEAEIEKEREVIIDEINSYRDSPSELIFDEFENLLFPGDALGHNILGDEKSLEGFDSEKCHSFVNRLYRPNNMVFFSMGSTPFVKLVKLLEKHLSGIESGGESASPIRTVSQPIVLDHEPIYMKMETNQAHVMIGARTLSMFDERRSALFVMNNILGGPGMNSRLNVSLREKSGLVYTVESNLTPYTDTGVFGIYFGTDPKKYKKGMGLVERELEWFRSKPMSKNQLTAAKKQLYGQLVVANENKENLALGMGKTYLRFGRYDSFEEVNQRIARVSEDDIWQLANDLFSPDKLLTLIIK